MANDQTTAPWWVVYFYDKKRRELGRLITQADSHTIVVNAQYNVAGCVDVRALQIGNEDNLPQWEDCNRLLQGDDLEAVFGAMRQSLMSNIQVFARKVQ